MRPTSWYPLAATDPVPGDPDALRQHADEHAAVAASIGVVAEDVKVLQRDPALQSFAVDELRHRTEVVAESIKKAHARYVAVAEALTTYASALRRAQEAADELLVRARATQQSLDEAAQQRLRAAILLRDLEDDPTADATDVRTTTRRLEAAREAVDDAEIRLSHLRDELETVQRQRDAAAQDAIDRITMARASDGLDDGWWEDWGLDVATQVSNVAGTVATSAGTAALVLCWVPIVGPALGVIATVAGAASLVANFLLAYNDEKGWTDFGIDALGMVSFGWSRGVAGALKGLAREMPETMTALRGLTARSGTDAVSSTAAAVNAATRGRLPSGELTIRGLFENGWRAAPDTYASAFREALSRVTYGPRGLLAMAGHGQVVTNRVLVEDVAEVVTHRKGPELLNPLLAKTSRLEQQVVWIHRIDVASNAYGAGQLTTGLTSPPTEPARERLGL